MRVRFPLPAHFRSYIWITLPCIRKASGYWNVAWYSTAFDEHSPQDVQIDRRLLSKIDEAKGP